MWQARSDVREAYSSLTSHIGPLSPKPAENLVIPCVLKRLQAGGWDHTKPGPHLAVLSQETQGVLAWSEWALNAKRIVCVAPELTQAFLYSDCGDMCIEDVAPEARAQYVHFEMGDEAPILFSDSQVALEGAFVLYAHDTSLRIVLCGRPVARLDVAHAWLERYDLRIKAEHFGRPAQEAIDVALADDLADLRNTAETMRQRGDVRSMASIPAADMLMSRMRADHEAYRRALPLILNTLAYLRIEPQDARLAWPPEAPERLVKQLDNELSPKAIERAHSKLWSLGHVPVTYIGGEFARTFQAPGHELRAHWRRGHWRRQAHGPQLSLRKLIWISPMVIGGTGEEMPA